MPVESPDVLRFEPSLNFFENNPMQSDRKPMDIAAASGSGGVEVANLFLASSSVLPSEPDRTKSGLLNDGGGHWPNWAGSSSSTGGPRVRLRKRHQKRVRFFTNFPNHHEITSPRVDF